MIGLTTLTYDLDGNMTLYPSESSAKLGSFRRRQTRTATIDGGSDFTDLGFTHSDMLFSYEVSKITEPEANQLVYLLKNYPQVNMSNKEGVFRGLLTNLDINRLPVTFDFLPIKKVSA